MARTKTSKILLWITILIYILGFFTENLALFVTISLISLIIGFKQFIPDRKDLKAAVYYCRLQKDPIKRPLFKKVISIIFVVAIVLIIYWSNKTIPKDISNSMSSFILFPMWASILAEFYQNFKNSLRSYTTGIKLPGRDQEIIDWKSVEEISFVDTTITVKAEQNENKYHIKAEDKDDLDRIIAMWKNETDNDIQL
jgi:ABC-type multidrug transport system fused ATPase/permease subunit